MPDNNALIGFGLYHNIKNNSAKTVDTNVSGEYFFRMSNKKIDNIKFCFTNVIFIF